MEIATSLAGLFEAEDIAPIEKPPEANLLTIELPEGDVPGFDVAWPTGWTGSNRHRYQAAEWAQYDGVRFVGKGEGKTHIRPNVAGSSAADSTVFIGPAAGRVEFHGVTVHCGPRKAIHCGIAKSSLPLALRLRDFGIVADPPPPGSGHGNSSVWGLFTYSTFVDEENGYYDCLYTAEHARYLHGLAKPGWRSVNVHVRSAGGEGAKCATRPSEVPLVPGCVIFHERCSFTNWGPQPWSWRGGAAIGAFQGTAAKLILIKDCVAIDRLGRPSRGLMVDDGGWDHYEVNGAAQGKVVVQNVLLSGQGHNGSWTPMMRAGSIGGAGNVAELLVLDGCGLYGELTRAEIQRVPQVIVQRCNTPEVASIAEGFGVDTSRETVLSVNKGWVPVSAGYVDPKPL